MILSKIYKRLSKNEKEDLCWKMMEGSNVYNMVMRESIKELEDALSEGKE